LVLAAQWHLSPNEPQNLFFSQEQRHSYCSNIQNTLNRKQVLLTFF
jgi:hypothetical protein